MHQILLEVMLLKNLENLSIYQDKYLSISDGKLIKGKVGKELNLEQAQEAAKFVV